METAFLHHLSPTNSLQEVNLKSCSNLQLNKNEFRFFPKHSSNASFIYRFWEYYNLALYAHYSSAYYAMGDMYVNERVTLNTSVTLQEILKKSSIGQNQ